MSDIEKINKELAEIHFILSGSKKLPELKFPLRTPSNYSGCGKGDDGGMVYRKPINPDEYYSL